MLKLIDGAKMPKRYPSVERKNPTVKEKGWDKVGNHTLRDKVDFMPQAGLQEKFTACNSNLIFLCGQSQMGKEQPYDALVLTPDGFVEMGSLKVGDTITGFDGGEQKVLAIFEQGVKEVYTIETMQGKCEAGFSHLWKFYLNNKWVVGSTAVMMEFMRRFFTLYLPSFNTEILKKNKILSIKPSGVRKPCRCILVSNPDSLYITNNYIVTHNTYGMFLKALDGVGLEGYTARFISVRLQDSKRGSSIFRDAVEVMGNFAECEYNTSDYPLFYWKKWNNSVQLTHSNFNVNNPTEWEEFKDFAKKNQASYIAIDEATEMRNFKMFAYWFSRNRDSSGKTPCMVASFNPEHAHFTTKMLLDGGYLGDDWYFKPEMNGVTRYFYIAGNDESSIIWGETPEEVAEAANISISEGEAAAGITINEIVKSFTAFTGEAADNLKLLAATKGQNIGNLHAVGADQRAVLKGGYFGPIENEELNVTRQMIHNLWTNPEFEDEDMYATLDVSGGGDDADDCPMIIWRGLTIIAIKTFRGNPKQLVDWIDQILTEYDIPVENFAFDATGIGYYLKAYSNGVPVTENRRAVQELDEAGNPVVIEQYFNLRSQLLGKTKVMFEKGEISCTVDKFKALPYGKKGRTRKLVDILMDEMNVFVTMDRGGKIYYRSKNEYKDKFKASPNLMDAIMLRAIFTLNGKPKKRKDPDIPDDAYNAIYENYQERGNVIWV